MRRRYLWCLLILLAVGGGLRLAGLSERGLFYYDEAYLTQTFKGPAIALRWAATAIWTGAPFDSHDLRQEFVRHGFPYASFVARQGYGALVILGMTAAGIRDVVPLAVNAILGTASVAMACRLGVLLQGPRAGLFAAGLLAFSPNHVFFSRSGLSHPTALFFALWAFCRYLARRRGDGKGLFGAGILGGLALVSHYSLFWAVPLLAAGEAASAIAFPGAPARAAGTRIARLVLGGAIPPLACEAAMRSAHAVFGAWIPGMGTYFSEFRYGLGGLMQTVFAQARSTPWFYAIHTVRTEGAIFAALLVAAAGRELYRLALRPREAWPRGAWLPALAVTVGYAVYSATTFRACRTLLVVFPLGAVLVGCLLDRWSRSRRALVLAVLLAHAALVAPDLIRSVGASSPYPALAQKARAEGRRLAAVDDFPVVDFYQGGTGEVFVRDRAAFERARREGPLWLVVVNRGGGYGFEDPIWAAEGRYAFVRSVVRSRRPIAVYPAGFPLEYDYADRELDFRRLWGLGHLPYAVEVYDLEGL